MMTTGAESGVAAVVRGVQQTARVKFDPRGMPRAAAGSGPRFSDPASLPARLAQLHDGLEEEMNRISEESRARSGRHPDTAGPTDDWMPCRNRLRDGIKSEANTLVREYLLVQYFACLPEDPADSSLALQLLRNVPPHSIAWSSIWGANPADAVSMACRAAREPELFTRYAQAAVETHPDPAVQAGFLYSATNRAFYTVQQESASLSARDTRGPTAAERDFSLLYDRLQTQFTESSYAQRAKARFAPDRRIRPGMNAPDLAVPSLDDSAAAVRLEDFRGHIVLLDFWAVWCGPCVAEMPHLHAAFKKYAPRGFAIWSLSLDSDPRIVREFRRRDWPLPWTHSWLAGGFRSEIARQFEVWALPGPILVDEHGTILALEGLRGEGLMQTLEKLYPEPPGVP